MYCTHHRGVSFSSFWQIERCAPKTEKPEKHTMECAPTHQEQILGTKRPLAKLRKHYCSLRKKGMSKDLNHLVDLEFNYLIAMDEDDEDIELTLVKMITFWVSKLCVLMAFSFLSL